MASERKEVVILNSYHNGFKWTNDINNAIASEFKCNESTRLFYEFMDSKRFNSEEYFEHLRNIFHLKYAHHKIDGIICSDNRAFNFFLEHGQDIWGDIPAVFCGVNDIDEHINRIDTLKHSVVYETIDIKGTLQLMLTLQPELEEIIVISDETLSGQIFVRQFSKSFQDLNLDINYKTLNNTVPDTLHKALHAIPSHNRAIYLLSLYTNRNNIPNEMINESRYFFEDINIPIYSNWDFLMPDLIVGGKILKANDQGRIAAQIMKQRFAGKPTKVYHTPKCETIIDYPTLTAHNLSTKELDSDYVVINQKEGLIAKYKKEITIILIILIIFVFIILMLISDIIKRKEIEIDFIVSEKRLELAINGANEGLWDINIPSKSIYISDQFAHLLGFDTADELDINEANWHNFIMPQDIEQLKEAYDLHINNKVEALQCEVRLLKKDGNKSWFSIHGKVTAREGDTPIRITGIILDINTQKAFEKELKNAKEKAEESDRLKSSFLANMSHEIRTPMNAILGFTDLLISSELTPEEKQSYLDLIKSSGENLLSLINDIIDISKIESGELQIKEEQIDLNQLIKEVVDVGISISNTLNKSIQIKTQSKLKKRNCYILTDPLRVYQILINLVSNAVKFTEKGFVEIIYDITEDSQLEIAVKDTGPGISNENQKIIFERFRQIDESTIKQHGGTGLGLAITQSLVNLIDGSIEVFSNPSQGATFKVSLPIKVIPSKESV